MKSAFDFVNRDIGINGKICNIINSIYANTTAAVVSVLAYADDLVILAESEKDLQTMPTIL